MTTLLVLYAQKKFVSPCHLRQPGANSHCPPQPFCSWWALVEYLINEWASELSLSMGFNMQLLQGVWPELCLVGRISFLGGWSIQILCGSALISISSHKFSMGVELMMKSGAGAALEGRKHRRVWLLSRRWTTEPKFGSLCCSFSISSESVRSDNLILLVHTHGSEYGPDRSMLNSSKDTVVEILNPPAQVLWFPFLAIRVSFILPLKGSLS